MVGWAGKQNGGNSGRYLAAQNTSNVARGGALSAVQLFGRLVVLETHALRY